MSQDEPKLNPIRDTTSAAIRLGQTLIRTASFGALGVIDPQTGFPLVSRVAVGTDPAGAPIILISDLAAHSRALKADNRCSLLVGEPGKGDPLAHPRITVQCEAQWLDKAKAETIATKQRFLRCHPKSKLYIDFTDFALVRLAPLSGNLNGGFGQAFSLKLNELNVANQHVKNKPVAIETLASQHADTINQLGQSQFPAIKSGWKIVNLDLEGVDIRCISTNTRIWFDELGSEFSDLIERIQQLRDI